MHGNFMDQLVTTFAEAVDWLQRRSTEMIRASRREMADGTAAFPPQVATHYDAFWLRDYAYLLAGDPDAVSHDEQIAACRLFVSKQRDDGAMVDCVKFDGTPIYRPGMGTLGDNPVADGSQFAVDVAWRTFRNTRNLALLEEILDALIRGLHAVPRSERGLVWIEPRGWDRCPYGFTDTIRKTGEELFCSLLLVQAQRQIADLLDAVSRDEEAASWRAESERVAGNVRAVFWDEDAQLFLAATRDCRQSDVWGSVFAAFLGVADEAQKRAIGEYSRALRRPGVARTASSFAARNLLEQDRNAARRIPKRRVLGDADWLVRRGFARRGRAAGRTHHRGFGARFSGARRV